MTIDVIVVGAVSGGGERCSTSLTELIPRLGLQPTVLTEYRLPFTLNI